jgi:hypothetical protein
MATYGKPGRETFQCDHCGMETSGFDRYEGNCGYAGCEKELCSGCLAECARCDGGFCPEHIAACCEQTAERRAA